MVAIVKWAVRIGIILSVVFAFIVLWNFIYSTITVSTNQNVVSDLLAIIQMWAPFDIDVLFAWVFTSAVIYITYRVTMWTAGLLNKFVGEG